MTILKRKFLTKQEENAIETCVQMRELNPLAPVDNQLWVNLQEGKFHLKEPSKITKFPENEVKVEEELVSSTIDFSSKDIFFQELQNNIVIDDVVNLEDNNERIAYFFRNEELLTKIGDPDIAPTNNGTDIAWSSNGRLVAITHATSPFVTIYLRTGNILQKLPNPNILPPSTANGIAFSEDGKFLAVAHNLTPFITIYETDADVAEPSFTKIPNPSPLPPSTGNGVKFKNNLLAVAHAITPFVTVYKVGEESASFTGQVAGMTTDVTIDAVVAGVAGNVTLTGDGIKTVNVLISDHNTAFPANTLVLTSGDGSQVLNDLETITLSGGTDLLTKRNNPDILPASTANDVAFSDNGLLLAVAHATTPFVSIYEIGATTLTKLNNPNILPVSTGVDVAFKDNLLAVAHVSTPFVTIYENQGNAFTKLNNPDILPVGNGAGVSFSHDGDFLAVAHATTPFITIYERNNLNFTKLVNPTPLPTGASQKVSFSPQGSEDEKVYLGVAHTNIPRITVYEKTRRYIELPPSIITNGDNLELKLNKKLVIRFKKLLNTIYAFVKKFE